MHVASKKANHPTSPCISYSKHARPSQNDGSRHVAPSSNLQTSCILFSSQTSTWYHKLHQITLATCSKQKLKTLLHLCQLYRTYYTKLIKIQGNWRHATCHNEPACSPSQPTFKHRPYFCPESQRPCSFPSVESHSCSSQMPVSAAKSCQYTAGGAWLRL
jgi:hypothetical protein